MSLSKAALPHHGVVWVASIQSLAVVLEPELPGQRRQYFLISDVGFEFSNMCNFNSSADIIDAAPMLKRFEDGVLNASDSSVTTANKGAVSFAIGVAMLEAVNKLISKCDKNKRVFPWNTVSPDLCLSAVLISTAPVSLKAAYEDAYHQFCVLVIKRDSLGYMNEVSRADDYHRFPAKYANHVRLLARGDASRHTQSSLRGHVKSGASPSAARTFVEFAEAGTTDAVADEGDMEANAKAARTH